MREQILQVFPPGVCSVAPLWGNDQVSIESTNNHLGYRCDIYAAMTPLPDWPAPPTARCARWIYAVTGVVLPCSTPVAQLVSRIETHC